MSEHPTPVWQLKRGDVLLGTLTLYEQDMFWFFCDFVALPEFEDYRSIFTEGLKLIDAVGSEEWEAWEIALQTFSLIEVTSVFHPITEFMLHIEGDKAWFRPMFA